MSRKLVIKWMYFGNIFIGLGIIISDKWIGLTIGNLFIGLEKWGRNNENS